MTADIITFAGLRVASFESRRADEMAHMIAKRGGVPFVSPSMREVALENATRRPSILRIGSSRAGSTSSCF